MMYGTNRTSRTEIICQMCSTITQNHSHVLYFLQFTLFGIQQQVDRLLDAQNRRTSPRIMNSEEELKNITSVFLILCAG
jgi:hypothetical protein